MTTFFPWNRATVTISQPSRCRDATLASPLFIRRVTVGFVHLTLASFPNLAGPHIFQPARNSTGPQCPPGDGTNGPHALSQQTAGTGPEPVKPPQRLGLRLPGPSARFHRKRRGTNIKT